MTFERIFTDPARKLVDEVADWLAARVRTDGAGAKSLAHMMVVVPTAQSGRRLRYALAKRFDGGLVPPVVRMPAHFAHPADESSVATRAEELLALWEARGSKGSLDVAAQLADIRRILGANALSFADVAQRVGDIVKGDLADVEVERWKDLAELESRYYEALAKRGREDSVAAAKRTVASPVKPEGVELVVVAGVLDPLPLMRTALENLGIKVVELLPRLAEDGFSSLASEQIRACGTAASECWRIAEYFSRVKNGEALPALCLADSDIYPEMQGAMQAKGLTVHNPSSTRLVTSSLGHLVAQLAAMKRTSSYRVFSAFVRGGDARRWICSELGLSPNELTDALEVLDRRQAEYLPDKMEDIGPKMKGAIRAVYELVSAQLRKKGVRELLQAIFRERILDERDADAREFAAAAEAVNEVIDECRAANAPESVAMELFERRLEEAVYSLEPDEGDAVLTDGWLELPYLDADEVVIAGFQEDCVPESVVGHAFLPDSLRRGLGLPDNDSRARRDLAILNMALACRRKEAVRISFHGVDANGDVLKPSRLLFACSDDAELASRVKRFYAQKAGTEEAPAADMPNAWKLKLPVPPAHCDLEFSSPSGLGNYLACPFTYYIGKLFGERMDDKAEELDPSEFGNLAHNALEAWANGPLRDSDDADAIASDLAGRVDALLQERFGAEVPAIVSLQGESVKRRLAHFASAQAERRREGWRIVASERKLQVKYGHTLIKGRCDRVDFNDQTCKWCVIDYKTWDNLERAKCYDAKSDTWTSLQLPLYCAMLDVDDDPLFKDAHLENTTSAYCLLAKTAEATGFTEPMRGDLVPSAERVARALIERIERGIFWPPSDAMAWRYDFGQWFQGSPADGVDAAWIEDQVRRIEAAGGEEAAE